MADNITSPDNVELHLPSILGYEKIARQAAEAVAEQMDFAAERIEDLKTAVAEACMNAIEHGNNLDRAIHVTVQMLIMPDKLEVRVADVGQQPMPDKLPPPGSGDMRGWGMFFIQNLVDEMQITRLPNGGNEVRMTLYLAPQAAESADAASPTPAANTALTAVETKPAAVLTVAEKPSAVLPVEVKPSAILPAEDKPSAVLPAEQKPSAILPAEDKPSAILPVEQPPTAIAPAEAKPETIQPAGSNPSAPEPSASSSGETPLPPES
jgi:serine/threonine-protein kinase RsbW